MCVLLITRLLLLEGSLSVRKPVKAHQCVAVVTPTDRPKSVLDRCVIEVLEEFLCCHIAFCLFLWV